MRAPRSVAGMALSTNRPESVSWGITADRIVLAVAVIVGLPSVLFFLSQEYFLKAIAVAVLTLALILARRAPGIALTVFWAGSVLNLGGDNFPQLIQVIAGWWLAYTCTRFGSRATVAASGISLAAGSLFAGGVLNGYFYYVLPGIASGAPFVFALTAGFLGLPWLIGLRQRSAAQLRAQRERAEDAEVERRYALEAQQHAVLEEQRLTRVAAAEAANARLARDVHDVVGHSLAVILMQAESAQYLTDPADLHGSMNSIATVARRSLGEIREVLQAARGGEQPSVPTPPGGLGALLDSVQASGVDLEVAQLGQARALPPDAETVAYRVLQEMLTNAIKHGEHGRPVAVSLTWADRLTIEVRNLDGGHTISRTLHGAGISGMTARLQAVGGRFELIRYQSAAGEVVTATAWLPLRTN